MKTVDYERRFIAFLIDIAFSAILVTFLLSMFGIFIDEFTLGHAIDIFFPCTCFALFFYLTFSYRAFKGLSIGGVMCNVRIVNKDGTDLRFKTCFIRAALLSLLILAVYNVFYMMLLRTQVSFYDEATDTRAIQRIEMEY